jgi:hypothetical protein
VTQASVMPAGKSNAHISVRLISEGESTSWNIYHLPCLSQDSKGVKFVIHLLKTLPVDLTHELMAQTSKEALNTVQFFIFLVCYCATHLALF